MLDSRCPQRCRVTNPAARRTRGRPSSPYPYTADRATRNRESANAPRVAAARPCVRASRAPAWRVRPGSRQSILYTRQLLYIIIMLIGIPNAHNIAIRLLEILRPTRRHLFRFITDTSWDTLSKVRRTHAPDASERAVKSRPVTSHTCTNFHRTRRFVTPKRNPLRKRFPKAKARPRGYRTEQNSYMRCTLSASHPPRTTLIAVRRPCGAPAAPSAGIVRVSCQCVLTISVTACFITTSVTACLVARGASTSAGVGHLAWKFVCARAHYAAAPASCA